MFVLDRTKRYIKRVGSDSKRKLKKLVMAAPFWVLLASVLLLSIGSIRAAVITEDRFDTRMNTVWSQGGSDYRHVAVYAGGARTGGAGSPLRYVDPETSIKRTDLSTIRTSLQGAADAVNTSTNKRGLNTDGSPNNWEDCWSSCLTGDVYTVAPSDNPSAPVKQAECDIVAVGGNFKAFHPFEYMSGGFLPEICTDPQLIVVNDVLAWRFFSSYDVVGFKVSLWGKVYTIAGVVAEPNSSMDKKADTDVSRAYVYFSTLEAEFLEDGAEDVAIQCYEAFLPEAVKGVAVNDMKTALPNYSSEDPKMLVISVTGRLFFTKVWQSVIPIGNSEVPDGIELPYWERASRIATEHLFVDLVLIILGIILLIIGIIMVVLKIRKYSPGDSPAEEDAGDEDEDGPETPGDLENMK